MNNLEHILTTVAEEGCELSQRCTKALRFSLDEVQPGQDLTNYERIWEEFIQLCAMMDMLYEEHNKLPSNEQVQKWYDDKERNFKKFLEYSDQCGTLNEW